MNRNKKRFVAIVLIMASVLCLTLVGYASADAYYTQYRGDVDLPSSVSSSGFTGTKLRGRTAGAQYQSWVTNDASQPYLTWQSQWKDLSTGYRHNGFDEWGHIISGTACKTYRSPYCNYTNNFLLKIQNSSNSSISLSGTWHP